MSTAKIIGDNIRRFRIDQGITQQQLAQRCGGRNVTQINAYERARSRPSEPLLREIAAALGVTPDLLIQPQIQITFADTRSKLARVIDEAKTAIAHELGVTGDELRLHLEIVS